MTARGRRVVLFGAPRIGPGERKAVAATLRSGWIGPGPRTEEFEARFGAYVGNRNAVAVNSGTAALHLALMAAGVKPGDEVVTTPLTFVATANAIMAMGAIPKFVDVERETQNIDPLLAARAVGRRTRAILPVHLAGRPCAMDAIMALARTRAIAVIEDSSHAIEALLDGRHAGTFGDFGCFSFTPNKNITTGDGGMVVSRRATDSGRIRMFAGQGVSAGAWSRFRTKAPSGYRILSQGFKYVMADLNASLGLGQLGRIEPWLERRKSVWEYYARRFAGLPVFLPSPAVPGGRHALHLYTVHLDLGRLGCSRDAIRHELAGKGVGTGVHYVSLHLHPYYRRRFGFVPEAFPNARWISERTVSLPLSPHLSDGEVEHVAATFRKVVGAHARRAAGGR